MKKIYVATTAAVCLVGLTYLLGSAWGQSAGSAADAAPSRVGLVDMGQVFKDYKKFEVLRGDLKDEIQASEEKAKAIGEKGQALQQELKSGTFKEGSKEYLDREAQLANIAAEFDTFRKLAQRDFERAEAKIYQQIYMEVLAAVKKAAEYHKYTVVMRFSRPDFAVSDPKKVPNLLNQQMVYYDPEDDLTDAVIDYLNRKYDAAATQKGTMPANKAPNTTGPAPKKKSDAGTIKQTNGTRP